MGILVRSALIVLALTTANPVYAGWQKADWNMTAEEVAAAMTAQAPLNRGSRGDRLGEKEIRNVGEYKTDEASFRTVYYYDQSGLSQVALYRKSGDCEKIAAELLTQYGQPVRVSDQIILRLIIWHDEAAQNRIRLMISRGVCNVHYERLSDYRAIDLASARAQ